MVIDLLLRGLVRALLALRYRVRVTGLKEVAARGRRGILFLANHPALIDPIILMSRLHAGFAPRALADRDQIDRPLVGWLARRVGVRPVPDLARYGPQARRQTESVLRECAEGLRRGENLLLYPSGHLYRTRFEDLRGNSSVETILRHCPEARVVLIRTRGLWGSSFSMISGDFPRVGHVLKRGALSLLASFLFFAPRREVLIECHEPADLPRRADRQRLNAFIEDYFNRDAPPATYVPYTIWERGAARELPDPQPARLSGSTDEVPPATRQIVLDHLRSLTGVQTLRDSDQLARDLGMDSLTRAELLLWLEREFGFRAADVASLQTVGDVLLAARGQASGSRAVELKPVPKTWWANRGRGRVRVPTGETITELFLHQARAHPRRVVLADQLSGARTYQDVVLGILALKPVIEELEGERIGLMLPASAGAGVVYLATLFAGRTPVMVNWTTGPRNMAHSLTLTGVRHVLTVRPLVARIEEQGSDLAAIRERLVFLEDVRARLTRGARLRAALASRLSWRGLERAEPPGIAVVLLTSGSESLPKAVPLTHANILANIRDVFEIIHVREDDSLLGFLPPFHSFGLTVTTVLPLVSGLRAVYHSNPTEPWVLARLVAAYRTSVVCGTPTFLAGIARAAAAGELSSLRLAVTGAEKCPEQTYELLARRCPNAVILEGYGVSECSPIIAVNREECPRPGTIGKVLPSYEYAIVDVDSGRRVAPGETGLLLVRGPCVFSGYLGEEVAPPFVELEGRRWYRTGDLVSADEEGVLTFRGRLKRFIKLGGEMISLPAIEAALERHFAGESREGPVLAVEATPDEERPEIVLFTTLELERAAVNRVIRAAGLSALHNVARVERVEAIPLLGTGKTDYRALRERAGTNPGPHTAA